MVLTLQKTVQQSRSASLGSSMTDELTDPTKELADESKFDRSHTFQEPREMGSGAGVRCNVSEGELGKDGMGNVGQLVT